MTCDLLKNQEKAWYVYIVICSDTSLYTGITTNLARRITEHNSPTKAAKYTRARQPVCLQYFEEYCTRSEASKREYQIKQLTRKQKLGLLSTFTEPCLPRQATESIAS